MSNIKKLPEGRTYHVGMGINADIIHRLDEVRVKRPELRGKSDGQVMKILALERLAELT